MSARNRPNHPCPNTHCGNTLYTIDYDYVGEGEARQFVRVWKCTNCPHVEPIKAHPRRSIKRIALDNWRAIRNEWKEVNDALDRLTDERNPNRIPSGCQLVHSSTFNHHLDKLLEGKLSNWELKYHTREARNDMARARNFVAEKGGFNLAS